MSETPSTTRFPDGFLWGAATSAYQVEGSPLADGAGAGIWHRFSHTPGRVHGGDTGDVACDHYRRYAEDVGWMRELGLTAYRFGLDWARIMPAGRGAVNRPGLDFYSRLIDLLLSHDIQPMITLYHWDLPAALEDLGGWLHRDSAGWFADFAEIVFRAFGDRVPLWATLNEPWVVVDAGYVHGVHPPAHRSLAEARTAAHHLLLAHGAAVERYRALARRNIGIVINLEPQDPASDTPEDRAAAARRHDYMNRQYLDPLFHGREPEGLREIYGDAWREFPESDYARIRQPFDFLGVNYYTRRVVRDDPAAWPERARRVRLADRLHTDTGWEVHPEGLVRTLEWVKREYGEIPIYITENGAAFPDPDRAVGDRVDDPLRVRYYRDHLLAAREAIARGVDLRGYFAWSLLDNFEWANGYALRFGLLHVDYETQRRTMKASGRYYAEVIRTRGESLGSELPEAEG